MISKYIKFTDKYKILKEYYEQYGNLNIKQSEKYKGYPVGKWLAHFRDTYKGKGNCTKLTCDQIKELESIGMIWGNIKKFNSANLFNKKYVILKEYYSQYGNLDIARGTVFNEYPIGDWLKQFRDAYKENGNFVPLTSDQIKQLESIGMIWNLRQTKKTKIPLYFSKRFPKNIVFQKWNDLNNNKNVFSHINLEDDLKKVMCIISNTNKHCPQHDLYSKCYSLYSPVFRKLFISQIQFEKDIKSSSFNLSEYLKYSVFKYYSNFNGLSTDEIDYLYKIYSSFSYISRKQVDQGYLFPEELDILKSISLDIEKNFKLINSINLSFYVFENPSDMIEDLIKYSIVDEQSIKKIYFDYSIRCKKGTYRTDNKINNQVSFFMRSGSNLYNLPKDYLKEICVRNNISVNQQKELFRISNNYNQVLLSFIKNDNKNYQRMV